MNAGVLCFQILNVKLDQPKSRETIFQIYLNFTAQPSLYGYWNVFISGGKICKEITVYSVSVSTINDEKYPPATAQSSTTPTTIQ